jgi:hypothetical protein
MATSSADPDKLDDYSTEGLDLIETLRNKSDAVAEALASLRSAGGSSDHVPSTGRVDEDLVDLVEDWFHLDEFVGDVAKGFQEADSGESEGGIVTVDDGDLIAAGEVGYADRDVAIAAAEEMADELDRMQEEGATAEEMDAWLEMASRGQYDPAFAVTFSEQVGVDGYADATAMFRSAYDGEGRDLDDALGQVGVLSTMLTTALDTLPGIDGDDLHDRSNADLGADDRLNSDFVYDLTRGYQPDEMGGPADNPWGYTGPDDLSVLIGMSDPPTEVAVDIAEYRMKPYLEDGSPTGSLWHDAAADPTVNYATMLGRNEDASALWLHGEGNIELVLDLEGQEMEDGGEAIAGVVEAGLTNTDITERVSGAASYVEGGPISEDLMDRAIHHMGGRKGDFDITNEHMFDALASGIEANMGHIDERVNGGWSPDGEEHSYAGGDEMADVTEFLSEVMADDGAAERVRNATFDYVNGQLGDLPVDEDGDRPRDRVHEAGRMLGVVMEGELAAIGEVFQEDTETATTNQKFVNFVVGYAPYVGDVNGVLDFSKNSLGERIYPAPDPGDFEDDLSEVEGDTTDTLDDLDLSGRDVDSVKAAMWDVGLELN